MATTTAMRQRQRQRRGRKPWYEQSDHGINKNTTTIVGQRWRRGDDEFSEANEDDDCKGQGNMAVMVPMATTTAMGQRWRPWKQL